MPIEVLRIAVRWLYDTLIFLTFIISKHFLLSKTILISFGSNAFPSPVAVQYVTFIYLRLDDHLVVSFLLPFYCA